MNKFTSCDPKSGFQDLLDEVQPKEKKSDVVSDHASQSGKEFSISCYENQVPPFVEPVMELLYGNVFSSLRSLRLTNADMKDLSTYIVRRGKSITTVFLFRQEHGRVRVMNEVINIGGDELQRFCNYIFATYKSVKLISFKAIQTDIKRVGFPYQRFNYSEDIFMALPGSEDAYRASLGKNTKRNIKRYTDRLARSFPSYRFEVYERDAIDERMVREVIGHNQQRMAAKQKVSKLDDSETRRITKLAQAGGLVGVITIDGRICAGAISYRSGRNYFLDVLAHDPAYDEYWIGILCCYRTICECIARGGEEFHFLWGRYDYKYTLGAGLHDLDCVAVYRSRLQMLMNADIAVSNLVQGYTRRAKLWINSRDNPVSEFILRTLTRLRNLKRGMARPLPE